MTGQRKTMQLIQHAIRDGRLKQPMRGVDLNKALGITCGGNFLAKHCLSTRQFHCPLRSRRPRALSSQGFTLTCGPLFLGLQPLARPGCNLSHSACSR